MATYNKGISNFPSLNGWQDNVSLYRHGAYICSVSSQERYTITTVFGILFEPAKLNIRRLRNFTPILRSFFTPERNYNCSGYGLVMTARAISSGLFVVVLMSFFDEF